MSPKIIFTNHMRDKHNCYIGPAYLEALDSAINEIKQKFARRIEQIPLAQEGPQYNITARIYKDIFKEERLDKGMIKH